MTKRRGAPNAPSMPNSPETPRPFRRSFPLAGISLTAAVLLFTFFMAQKLPLFSGGGEIFPRWLVLALPILDGGVYAEAFGAESFADFFLPRVYPLLFTFLAFFAALSLGTVLLAALGLRRSPDGEEQTDSSSFGLTRNEFLFFGAALGLAACSAIWSGMAVFGLVRSDLLFRLLTWGTICPFAIYSLAVLFRKLKAKKTLPQKKTPCSPFVWILTLGLILFGALYLCGGMIPPFEYDMLEYHAESAREIFESGGLGFAEGNAYMNMPLGAESLFVWGMSFCAYSLFQDLPAACSPAIPLGVECGKTLLAFGAILTAWGLAAFGERFFRSKKIGLVAAFCYLAFPDNYQTFANGLNDGLLGLAIFALFYALALFALARTKERTPGVIGGEIGGEGEGTRRKPPLAALAILSGAMAGFAVSIKYTGVVFAAIPAFLTLSAILFAPRFSSGAKRFSAVQTVGKPLTLLSLFLLAAILFGGVWYAKNLYWTGNPFWPLATSIFGDATGTWSGDIAARWSAAHSADSFSPGAFCSSFADFFARSDFASPLLAVFGPLAVFFGFLSLQREKSHDSPSSLNDSSERTKYKTTLFALFGGALFFALLWWTATHRLLRFLVPLMPILALLLADGFAALSERLSNRAGRGILCLLLFLGGGYALSLDALTSNGLLAPYETIAADPLRYGDWAVWLNQHPEACRQQLPEGGTKTRLLLAGEAEAFAYRVPTLYSTCWNRTPLRKILPAAFLRRYESNGEKAPPPFNWTNAETAEMKSNVEREKIALILVDDGEIARFLSPGNYGLTDAELLRPELFESLERAGIIERFIPPEYDSFSERTKNSTVLYRTK